MTDHSKKASQEGKPRFSVRSRHRQASHENAHADAEQSHPQHTSNNPLIPHGPTPLVTNKQELTQLLEHLRAVGRFAYDSEFIGELTYVPKLCLIQVASHERVALIDPLAGLDLKPFWELIADPSVEKIVHAGQQDVEPVVRHLGRGAVNLFDTQIAAGFVGLAYPVALSKLVYELVGARLGKGLTFTHWDQRPLSAMQLRYAADDVRYLPALREELGRRLDERGHAAWAAEECAAMCDPSQFGFDPDANYLRVRGATSLQPLNLAILRELTIWRDSAARSHDVPPRAFLKDEILLDLARSPVKTVEKLDRVRGLPRPIEHAHGSEIVEVTLRALALPQDKLPAMKSTEQSPAERFGGDALWSVVQCLCAGRSIDPALVVSRQDVGEIYRALITQNDSSNGLPDSRLFSGWRHEAIGRHLLDLIHGRNQITLTWPDDSLRAEARSI